MIIVYFFFIKKSKIKLIMRSLSNMNWNYYGENLFWYFDFLFKWLKRVFINFG